jgi:hypothetical protein
VEKSIHPAVLIISHHAAMHAGSAPALPGLPVGLTVTSLFFSQHSGL